MMGEDGKALKSRGDSRRSFVVGFADIDRGGGGMARGYSEVVEDVFDVLN
jgi:hypothetical protein